MKKRIADIIMDVLIENNITDCFCVVGGGSMQINNALAIRDDINKYYCHHEQACAMSAEGYFRTSGRMPLVCVTTGPGGTNTLTGVLCAWQDNIPMLIISGQVRYEVSVPESGLNLKQRGEQEFNIVPVVSHMTKYAKMIVNPLDTKRELQKAINIAMIGRCGPVWLDIPLNVQGAVVEEEDLYPTEEVHLNLPCINDNEVDFLNTILCEAERPCILVGSAVRTTNTTKEFRKYVEIMGIPVVGGIHVADAHYTDYPLYYGMSGTLGPRCGNFILQNADVIIALGNSLHLCQTGFNQDLFAPKARIVMIDIDQNEAMKPGLHIYRFIQTDIRFFFKKIIPLSKKIECDKKWINYCDTLKKRFPFCEIPEDYKMEGKIRQNYFWSIFEKYEPEDAIVAFGNSMGVLGVLFKGIQHPNQRLVGNNWVGSMGNDLPEAFGASIGAGKREVYCITGDGSIMMNLQELQTIRYYRIPVKVILFSNNGYGAIRLTCKNFFNGKMVGCDPDSGLGMPDFEKVAKAFGYSYRRCSTNNDVEECIKWLFKEDGNLFLEVIQDEEDVYTPKLTSRLRSDNTFSTPALHDMAPFISEEELANLMISDGYKG